MGSELAKRLLLAGHDVAVCNRTRAKAEHLTEFGASVVDRPEELADRDVVFTSVPSSPDLLAVTVGAGGVLTAPGAAPSGTPSFWPRRSAATHRWSVQGS